MKNNIYGKDNITEQEKLENELYLLDLLKKEEEENFLPIMRNIRRKRYRRIFLTAVPLAAACVAAFFYFAGAGLLGRHASYEPDSTEVPILITDSGNAIELDKEEEEILLGRRISITNQTNRLTYTEKQPENSVSEGAGTSVGSTRSEVRKDRQTEIGLRDGRVERVRKNTVVIPSGYTYSILLADGSEVFLNSRSNIKYPVSFEGEPERVIEMKGEAYFKVAKSDRPFIVKAGGLEIKVYGTEFNVNTNKKGYVETILVSGSVGVRDMSGMETMLSPNELHRYNLERAEGTVTDVHPEDYLGWMKGDFTYDGVPLATILDEISAHYGINITYTEAALHQNASISLSRKLGYRQIMQILESALGVSFEKTDNKNEFICSLRY